MYLINAELIRKYTKQDCVKRLYEGSNDPEDIMMIGGWRFIEDLGITRETFSSMYTNLVYRSRGYFTEYQEQLIRDLCEVHFPSVIVDLDGDDNECV